MELSGFELEGNFRADSGWFMQGSYVYYEDEDELGNKDITLTSDFSIKAGVGYSRQNLHLGLFNIYHDAYKDLSGSEGIMASNPKTNDHHLLGLNLAWHFSIPSTQALHCSLRIRGTNLLDEQVWVADFLSRDFNSLPGHGGRALYAGVAIDF